MWPVLNCSRVSASKNWLLSLNLFSLLLFFLSSHLYCKVKVIGWLQFHEKRNFYEIVFNFAKFLENYIVDFREIFAKLSTDFAKFSQNSVSISRNLCNFKKIFSKKEKCKNKQRQDIFKACIYTNRFQDLSEEGWMMSCEWWGVRGEWWGVSDGGWLMRGERWGVSDEG